MKFRRNDLVEEAGGGSAERGSRGKDGLAAQVGNNKSGQSFTVQPYESRKSINRKLSYESMMQSGIKMKDMTAAQKMNMF